MKKNTYIISLALLLSGLLSLTLFSSASYAECKPSPGEGVYCCGDVQTAVDYNCNEGTDSVTSLILYVVNFLAIGVGVVVVFGIAWGGWMYASANGDASKAKNGQSIVINAVIGLVMFFFLWAAVNFLVPGGLFG